MQMIKKMNAMPILIIIGVVGMICGLIIATVQAEGKKIRYRLPQGIYIELPEAFVASTDGEPENMVVYTDQLTSTYLEQIAASSATLVQTNNAIIQQQERIIQLLEALLAKPAPEAQ